ncbi:MAG: ammonium transporter [Coriobacteriia bacterium]|nr:ammonium transporter [Coriobacteriia bacterium]
MDTGSTAWMLVSAALVLFMTPGLALFYAGMVRKKNVLSSTMHSFFAMGLVSIIWALIGYTLAFGGDVGGVIGNLDFAGLKGVLGSVTGTETAAIPTSVFAMYQGMFAIITVGLITGAIAERMKFKAYVIFAALWAVLVYSPLAHWVWGGGWLMKLGALDFAGGTVVHIASAAAALAAALVLGKRKGYGTEELKPHNIPMSVLGAGILWFGWFGFNAGSALASGHLAGSAFLVTHLSAAAGLLAWNLAEVMTGGKPTVLGAASGAVAGLVGITPAAGFVEPLPAIVIGLIVGAACFFGLRIKSRFGFDDALDVVGVHGVGGTLGALLTGVFATVAVNAAGADGLLAGGGFALLGKQAIGVIATIAFSFTISFIILKVLDATMGIRVDEETESAGLDIAEHAETGYEF